MANFATHIGVGTVITGGLATLTLAANVIVPEDLIAVTMAGVLGSILPDIDLKDSRASRALFSTLAGFVSFCVLFLNASTYSIVELWLLWLAVFVAIRYGAEALFHRFSYHRGIWHSLIAGLLFWFVTAIVYKWVLGRNESVAWLAGTFMFIGYLTHLVLDEIYSVDLMDRRLKQSFGSALKLYDGKHVGESVLVGLVAIAAFLVTPPSGPFVEGITSRNLWAGLHQRLLPDDKWFGVIGAQATLVGPDATAAGITTGSVTRTETQPAATQAAARPSTGQ